MQPIMNYMNGSLTLKQSAAFLGSQPITIGATVDMINQHPEVIRLGSQATVTWRIPPR